MGSGERRRSPAEVEMCTESLGSESGYGGDGEIELPASPKKAGAGEDEGGSGFRRSPENRRRTEWRLPPAMPRLDAYMRSERRDGRLILTEVRIERQEVFHVSRSDGRLRLHLVGSPDGRDEAAIQRSGSSNNGSSNSSGGISSIGGGGGSFCQVAAAAGGGGGGGGARMMVVL